MTEFIWENFGLIELVLATELVVLLAAAFFYQVAKIIAKTDRHDPIVRFYRVFWLSFFASVSSIKDLDLRQAEYAARSAGVVGLGDASVEQLSNLDAPDLGGFDDLGDNAPPARDDDAFTAPQTKVVPIGRTGGEDDARLRTAPLRKGAPAGPSRELQFAEKARTAREQPAPPAEDESPIPISRERDVTAPGPPPTVVPTGQSAATSVFDACINPFRPQPAVVGRREGEVLIDVTCAPEDGQANGTVIALMAERLGVRPYQIVLLRGHYKVRKTLQVAGLDQPTLNARLKSI